MIQFDEGMLQGLGALADLLGQQHRVLEGGIGGAAGDAAGLDPLDQRRADPPQPSVLLLQRALPLAGRGDRLRGAAEIQWRPR